MFTYEVRGKSDNMLVKVFPDEQHLSNQDAANKAVPMLVEDGFFGGTFVMTVTYHLEFKGKFDFDLTGDAHPLRAVVHDVSLTDHDRTCMDMRY